MYVSTFHRRRLPSVAPLLAIIQPFLNTKFRAKVPIFCNPPSRDGHPDSFPSTGLCIPPSRPPSIPQSYSLTSSVCSTSLVHLSAGLVPNCTRSLESFLFIVLERIGIGHRCSDRQVTGSQVASLVLHSSASDRSRTLNVLVESTRLVACIFFPLLSSNYSFMPQPRTEWP